MKTKFKPCPFCNEEINMEIKSLSGRGEYYQVAHDVKNCGARGPKMETCESAIEAWNKRKPVNEFLSICHKMDRYEDCN